MSFQANRSLPEFDSQPDDLFVAWLHGVIGSHSELQLAFKNETIRSHVTSIDELINHLAVPDSES